MLKKFDNTFLLFCNRRSAVLDVVNSDAAAGGGVVELDINDGGVAVEAAATWARGRQQHASDAMAKRSR